MRVWAQCLITYEVSENYPPGTKTPPAFYVLEKLRPRLTQLMGQTGCNAMTLRALALARPEAPALEVIHLTAAGAFEGFDQFETQFDHEQKADGGVILLARLLGLLVTLIGGTLSAQIVGEVWPELSPSRPGGIDRTNDEKGK